ncbi:MAG TPA: hypothetical protein VH325_01845 [Bryobacteraceae bacterium]|nr:hypothetical protein [Bryobacteraceae bacterium]
MRLTIMTLIAALFISGTLGADTLGFVEQKFTFVHFDIGKWSRTAQLPCYSYVAQVDGASVEVMRLGAANLVTFKAKKGLTVTVCGSNAAFDEGFEAGTPIAIKSGERRER